jgi:8-oxo-dGTP pyrophosphatase MutT (NUDIX family)
MAYEIAGSRPEYDGAIIKVHVDTVVMPDELAEETGLTAEIWSTLVDLRPSSGISTEVCRVYHAERLTQGNRRGEQEGEKSDLQSRWPPPASQRTLAGRRRIARLPGLPLPVACDSQQLARGMP